LYIFAEGNSHINNSTSVKENKEHDHVCSETKLNTLHNTEYDAKINAERRTPLHILNCEEKNNSRVECPKRRQNLLNTDNGKNVNFILHLQASLNKVK